MGGYYKEERKMAPEKLLSLRNVRSDAETGRGKVRNKNEEEEEVQGIAELRHSSSS